MGSKTNSWPSAWSIFVQGAGDVLRSMKGELEALRQVKVHAWVVGVVVRVRRRVVRRGRDFILFSPVVGLG